MERTGYPGVLVAVLSIPLWAAPARAHVRYVTDSGRSIDALRFLVETLSVPANLLVLGGGALVLVGTVAAYLGARPVRRDVTAFRAAMRDYRDLVPWLLRLSVGLPLVASGFAGYLFTPLVAAPTRLFGTALGFLLLFGLATRAAAAFGLGVYLVGVAFEPALLLAVEYVPAFVAIVLLGPGRPSADHVLVRVAAADDTVSGRLDPVSRRAAALDRGLDQYRRFVPTVVRSGLGLAFVVLGATQKLLAPGAALAVVATYDLTALVPVAPELWVLGAGLLEVGVGLALLAGLFTRAASLVAFGLFTLTLFGLPDDPVLAHVSLFGLVSVLLVTGAGPLSADGWLAARSGHRSMVSLGPADD